MRIIGGKYKRRRFDVPKSFNARPTTDFAKENLFNVLQGYIDWMDSRCLDLFSGTGSIAAECVSRGASCVVSVEQRREHALFIRSVARVLAEEQAWQVLQTDVFRYLQATGTRGRTFDFIFADPPYRLETLASLPDVILSSDYLAEGGLLVLEHPKAYDFSEHPCLIEHRAYGSVNFSFFRLIREGEDAVENKV